MARELGRAVMLQLAGRRIVTATGGVSVTPTGMNVRAKRVIVAVPPVLAGPDRLHAPGCRAARRQLTQRLPQGTLLKVTAVYDRPFWREKGLNGTAVSLNGPVNATFDDSPPDGSPGVMFGFVGGDERRRFLAAVAGRAARRGAEELHRLLRCPRPRNPTRRTSRPTGRPSAGRAAARSASPGPACCTPYGPALRQPIGRIHWAGTETSNYWNGYMDGAMRSGERAAREVLDAL